MQLNHRWVHNDLELQFTLVFGYLVQPLLVCIHLVQPLLVCIHPVQPLLVRIHPVLPLLVQIPLLPVKSPS